MMLEYYYNRMKNDALALKKTFHWNNSESIFSLKTAIACIISMLIAYSMELEQGYWASISSLLVMLPSAGATAKKALFRFFGTSLGALAAIFISGLFAQNHICYSISIFLLVSVCLYISLFSQYSYFWFLLPVTASIIMISAIAGNSPEQIIYIAFNRWVEVSIGIAVTSFMNLLIWPQYAAHDYHKKSIEIKKNYSEFLKSVFEQYMKNEYDIEQTRKDYENINKKVKIINELVDHARFEIKTARRQKSMTILDTKQLKLNLNHIWDFFLSISKFDDLNFHKSYCQYIREVFNVSASLCNIKNDFTKQAELINLSNSYIEQINKRYLRNKAKKVNEEFDIKDVYLFQEFLLILKEFVEFSKNKIFYNSKTVISAENKLMPYFPEEIFKSTFFNRQFEISIPIAKFAIKAGISVVAVIWFWQYFEIPSGGSNMAVAVLLIFQPDAMTTYLKGMLRFFGCLGGALLGFVFLSFQIESTFMLCIFIIVVVYFSMYIYYKGGPGISYAGLQIALAFLVAALPEPHATMETVHFIDRLFGIFFGVCIAWIVNITIFSKDLLSSFKDKLIFLENKIASSAKELQNLQKDFIIPDLGSFYSALNVITDQKEINMEDSFFLNKYLKNVEKFFRIRYLLLSAEIEAIKFVDEINPEIRKDISDLIDKFSKNRHTLKDVEQKISMTLKKMEDLRVQVRYNNLSENKSVECRQQYCQYSVNIKRMLFTLLELFQVQEKINI